MDKTTYKHAKVKSKITARQTTDATMASTDPEAARKKIKINEKKNLTFNKY
jgi:hypothetical protein